MLTSSLALTPRGAPEATAGMGTPAHRLGRRGEPGSGLGLRAYAWQLWRSGLSLQRH